MCKVRHVKNKWINFSWRTRTTQPYSLGAKCSMKCNVFNLSPNRQADNKTLITQMCLIAISYSFNSTRQSKYLAQWQSLTAGTQSQNMISTIVSWLKCSCWLPGMTCLLLLDIVTSEFDISCEDKDSGCQTLKNVWTGLTHDSLWLISHCPPCQSNRCEFSPLQILHQPKLNSTQLNTMQRRDWSRLLNAVWND